MTRWTLYLLGSGTRQMYVVCPTDLPSTLTAVWWSNSVSLDEPLPPIYYPVGWKF